MAIVKSSIKYLFIILAVFLVFAALWVYWEHNRDHLHALDPGSIDDIVFIKESIDTTAITDETRVYRDVTLYSRNTGKIIFYISLPAEIPAEGLPIILILGGLRIGRENFSLIENPGNNAVVIYKYPYDDSYWYDGTALIEIPKIRNAVLSVPAQVLEVVHWLQEQSWYDGKRLSIAGYSFGALFTPAVYHLAEGYKIALKQGIICYGGLDIYTMLKTNLKKHNAFVREIIALVASTAIYSIDPKHHVPYLENEFLLINGSQDKQIPMECWLDLQKEVPEPKTIMILNEGHMHPDKPELTRRLVNLSRDWLLKKGVLNH